MISILTPTRNSPKEFQSLISNKSLVEVLIKIDDDTDDRKYVESTMRRSGFKYIISSSPRGKGYLDIYKYRSLSIFQVSTVLLDDAHSLFCYFNRARFF